MISNNSKEYVEIEYLLEVLEIVQMHGGSGIVNWLNSGIDAFMLAEGSLDECLMLKPCKGERHIAAQYHAWKRNQFLFKAWSQCVAKTPWKQSGVLARHVKEFKEQWPGLSDLRCPDPAWSDLRSCLFQAFRYGAMYPNGFPPVSQRQVHDIVRPVHDVSALNAFLYKVKA